MVKKCRYNYTGSRMSYLEIVIFFQLAGWPLAPPHLIYIFIFLFFTELANLVEIFTISGQCAIQVSSLEFQNSQRKCYPGIRMLKLDVGLEDNWA